MQSRNGSLLLTTPLRSPSETCHKQKTRKDFYKNYGKKNKTSSTNDFHRKKNDNSEFLLKIKSYTIKQ